jgi:hypothetical protein
MNQNNKIEWTRIDKDVNGNPRYVCHHSDLLTEQDKEDYPLTVSPVYKVNDNLAERYKRAVRNAKEISNGKKYSTKKFAGGIVFQSHNIHETERLINEFLTKVNK